MISIFLRPVMAFMLALILCTGMSARATPVQFQFVDLAGKPVDWGQNEVRFMYGNGRAPSFLADVAEGTTLLLNMYLITNHGGTISSLSPDVTIVQKTPTAPAVVTIMAEPISRSPRSVMAIVWANGKLHANGKLYAAENLSNDGTNRNVDVFYPNGVIDRIPTVDHPRAIAVSRTTLYVMGDSELAAFNLKDSTRLYSTPVDYGKSVIQMALLGDRLYVGDKSVDAVRILDAATGKELDRITGADPDKLKTTPGFNGIGVAVGPRGSLVVSDAFAIREFTPEGKLVRTIVAQTGGASVAVDAQGDVAEVVPFAKDPDFSYMSEIKVFDWQGMPLLRKVSVYMSGPRPDPKYKLRYFGGILGRLLAPGGVAFDDRGNLYVSELNDGLKDETTRWGQANFLPNDGGILKINADGDVVQRLGSRFTPAFVQARMEQRKKRLPLQQTAAAIQSGKTLSLLAWGDSITQTGPNWNGGASNEAHNWVHVLADLLEKEHPGLKVKAESNGVGGQNAAEGLSRNPVPVWYVQPDLILLQFGTNDTDFHYQTPQRFAQSLRDMITTLFVQTDSDIVLLTNGPLAKTAVEPEQDYVDATLGVGKEFGIPVVNIDSAVRAKLAAGAPWVSLHLDTGNPHPNDAGHEVWAAAVLDTLDKVLKEASSYRR